MANENEVTVVEAVGTASASFTKGLGAKIEAAMADAVKAAQAEAEQIWLRKNLSPEQKQEKIAAITSPEAVRARMMKAREDVKKLHAAR